MIRTLDDPRQVAEALLAGHLAILPTETVYGLAARADDGAAVARIFEAKGRPAGHPLIVHLADTTLASAWVGRVDTGAARIPDYAHTLAGDLWPGPLTLVVPRGPRASNVVTGGQDTVAIRVPAHPLMLAVIEQMDDLDPAGAPHGIAAPSANRFGRVSPTSLAHAITDLGDHLSDRDVALDGGPCDVGVESTIIDCTGDAPVILRPGGVDAAAIARITGLSIAAPSGSTVRVPGALPSHYAPQARVLLAPDAEAAHALVEATELGGLPADQIGVLACADVPTPDGAVRLASPMDADAYARDLYAALRRGDEHGVRVIVAVPPAGSAGVVPAIADRLRRAATHL